MFLKSYDYWDYHIETIVLRGRLEIVSKRCPIRQQCIHPNVKHLGSFRSFQKTRVALCKAFGNSGATFVLSKLPTRCIWNLEILFHRLPDNALIKRTCRSNLNCLYIFVNAQIFNLLLAPMLFPTYKVLFLFCKRNYNSNVNLVTYVNDKCKGKHTLKREMKQLHSFVS